MSVPDLLKKPKIDILKKGKILTRDSVTRATVIDSKGRKFTVESDGSYVVGQFVLIKNGVIIGVTKQIKTVNHFNV